MSDPEGVGCARSHVSQNCYPGVTGRRNGEDQVFTQSGAPVWLLKSCLALVSLRASCGSKTPGSAPRAALETSTLPSFTGLGFGRRGRYKHNTPEMKGRYYLFKTRRYAGVPGAGFWHVEHKRARRCQPTILRRMRVTQTHGQTCASAGGDQAHTRQQTNTQEI